MQETWIWKLILPLGYSLYQSVAALTAFSGRKLSSSRVAKWYQVRTHSSSPFPCGPCCFPSLLPCHPYLERSPPLLFRLLLALSTGLTTGSLTSEWVCVTILRSFHPFFPSPWRAVLLLLHLCSSDDEVPGPEARIGASAPEPHGHGGLWAHT